MHVLERELQIATLWEQLRQARQSGGRMVLVSGEAGIGKSTLVRSFCDAASTRARIRWGSCDASITPRPLGPLFDIARDTGGELAELITAGAAVESLFRAFYASLADRPVPTVVVFEDVHWADEATLDLLRFLARRVDRSRALVVLTFRDDELGRDHPLRMLLGDLASSPGTSRISLEPLSTDAVAELSGDRPVDVDKIHAITGGNPFFVTELLGADRQDQLPVTVRDAVLARAARLRPDQRDVADVVALARPPAPVAMALAVSGADPAAVDGAIAAGVLVSRPQGLAFRHELARRVTHDHVPPGRRSEIHAATLRWLAQRPVPEPTDLAHHAEGAGDRAAVLTYAPAAAAHASVFGAHREAAAQYAAALRWADGLDAAAVAELLEAHSVQAYLSDDIATAVVSRERAVELRRPLEDPVALGDSLRWLSRVLWVAGRNADAEAAGAEALALLADEPAGHHVAMAHSNQAQLAMLRRDFDPAVRHGTRAIELASACGDTEALVHALNNVGTAQYMAGRPEHGRKKLERSLQLARTAGLHDHAARALCNLGSSTGELREYGAAQRFLVEGITFCDDHQQDYFGNYLKAWLARCHFEQGRWSDAQRDARELVERPSVAAVTRIVALTVLGRIAVRRGDASGALLLAEAGTLADGTGDLQRTWPVAAGQAEAAWLRGDDAAIALAARAAYELALAVEHPWATGELGSWLVQSGELDELPAFVAAPYRLQADGDPGAAAAAWADLGCPYEQASALLAAGSDAQLRAAFALADELGAGPLSDLIARRLRDAGVRGYSRRGRSAATSDLTPRQAEVLQLMVQGLRDADIASRLFISPKTAGHHVSAILAKFQVSSRAAAVAEAHRRGLAGAAAE